MGCNDNKETRQQPWCHHTNEELQLMSVFTVDDNGIWVQDGAAMKFVSAHQAERGAPN